MAYTTTNWKNGDVITAVKLNKLEQGVADIFHLLFPVNVEVNHDEDPKYTADKTYDEVCALMDDGRVPIYIFHHSGTNIIEGITYHIPVERRSSQINIVDTADDYVLHQAAGVMDGMR